MSVRDLLMAAAGAVAPGGVAYRYWRIYITALNSSSPQALISEVELRGTVGGADLTTSATPVIESNAYDNGEGVVYGGSLTVDNDSTYTYWTTTYGVTAPYWLRYDLATARVVSEVAIYGLAPYQTQGPRDFKIQGSADGSSWTDVKSFTAVAAWTGWQAFNLT